MEQLAMVNQSTFLRSLFLNFALFLSQVIPYLCFGRQERAWALHIMEIGARLFAVLCRKRIFAFCFWLGLWRRARWDCSDGHVGVIT